jgi:tetratricopeptide (TPR) repeat protein
MTKKFKGILLFAILIITIGVIISYKRKGSSEVVTIARAKKLAPRIKLSSSKVVIAKNQTHHSIFPKQCFERLSDLSLMTAEEYKDLAHELKTFAGDTCFNSLVADEDFNKLLKLSNCDLKKSNDPNCMVLMFMLKAYFIADQTGYKPAAKMSSEELAAQVVRMFFDLDSLDKEKFKKHQEILNAFKELHPEDSDIREAYIGYLLVGKETLKDQTVNEKISELLEESDGSSFKLDRLGALKEMFSQDSKAFKTVLDQLSTKYSDEAELSYYYGAYYWKLGDKEKAQNYVNEAIKLSKTCSYCSPDMYKSTLSKMGPATKDEKVFSLSVGLKFDNF